MCLWMIRKLIFVVTLINIYKILLAKPEWTNGIIEIWKYQESLAVFGDNVLIIYP